MAKYLKMPKLSDTMTEGKIAKWNKKEGDSVAYGEEIADIETDKATMAWEASGEGIVHKIYVAEDESALLGTPLMLILEEGEEPPADADNPPGPEAETDQTPEEIKESSSVPSEAGRKRVGAREISTGSGLKASPLARKVAAQRGLDLSRVRGSGPGGRIVRSDLDYAYGESGGPARPTTPPMELSDDDEEIKLSGMRQVIADRLLESKTTIPHFYLNIEVDAAPLMETRSSVNEKLVADGGAKLTVNDFVMKAVVLAAQEVPEVNASFAGDSIYQYSSVSLAVAVAVEGGLVTPVIKKAEEKSMDELSAEIKDLATRARDKKLTPDEMQGGTITISNLGAYGIDSFDAIINPPQSAILSIGTISKQPVVNEKDEIVAGLRMWIGMSCDHRVIDGAVGATYLAALKKNLESPESLVS